MSMQQNQRLETNSILDQVKCRYLINFFLGTSINYVSMFEGGGGHEMLMDAYVGEGGISEMLT